MMSWDLFVNRMSQSKKKVSAKGKVCFKTSPGFVNMLWSNKHSYLKLKITTKKPIRTILKMVGVKRLRGGYSKIGCIFEYLNSNRSQPYANLPS